MDKQNNINMTLLAALESVLASPGVALPVEITEAARLAVSAAKASEQPALSVTDCLQCHCAQCGGMNLDVTAMAKFRPNERWRLLGFVSAVSTFFFCHDCNEHVTIRERNHSGPMPS
jgi:hypothetical protein